MSKTPGPRHLSMITSIGREVFQVLQWSFSLSASLSLSSSLPLSSTPSPSSSWSWSSSELANSSAPFLHAHTFSSGNGSHQVSKNVIRMFNVMMTLTMTMLVMEMATMTTKHCRWFFEGKEATWVNQVEKGRLSSLTSFHRWPNCNVLIISIIVRRSKGLTLQASVYGRSQLRLESAAAADSGHCHHHHHHHHHRGHHHHHRHLGHHHHRGHHHHHNP